MKAVRPVIASNGAPYLYMTFVGSHSTSEREKEGVSPIVLLNPCKDIDLVVNRRKTKYMEIGRHRGVIANEHIKIGSNSYEKVETFK